MKWWKTFLQIALLDVKNLFLTSQLWYFDCKIWWIDFSYFLRTGKQLENKFNPENHRREWENMKKFAEILPGATIQDYDVFVKNSRRVRFMSIILLKYEIAKFFKSRRQ